MCNNRVTHRWCKVVAVANWMADSKYRTSSEDIYFIVSCKIKNLVFYWEFGRLYNVYTQE